MDMGIRLSTVHSGTFTLKDNTKTLQNHKKSFSAERDFLIISIGNRVKALIKYYRKFFAIGL